MSYKKRIDHELGDKYKVLSVDLQKNRKTHILLDYNYNKSNHIIITITDGYPFEPPVSITKRNAIDPNLWTHDNYESIKRLPYMRDYIDLRYDCCLECQYKFGDWSPQTKLNSIIEKHIKFDKMISNIIKTELVFRNVLQLPEDLKGIVFSYLNEETGL